MMGIFIIIILVYVVIWAATRSSRTQNKKARPAMHPPITPQPGSTSRNNQQFTPPSSPGSGVAPAFDQFASPNARVLGAAPGFDQFAARNSGEAPKFEQFGGTSSPSAEGKLFQEPTIMGEGKTQPILDSVDILGDTISSRTSKGAFYSHEGKSFPSMDSVASSTTTVSILSKQVVQPTHGVVRTLFRSKQDLRRAIVYHEILSPKFRQ